MLDGRKCYFDPYLESLCHFFIAKSSNPLSLSCVGPFWGKKCKRFFSLFTFLKNKPDAARMPHCFSFVCPLTVKGFIRFLYTIITVK